MMQHILLTGGYGFLGKHVYDKLTTNKQYKISRFHSSEYDLTKDDYANLTINHYKPDIIIHMAAICGGIGANRKAPGDFYYKNLIMGTQLLEHARLHKIEKVVIIGTVCAYPSNTPTPFKEEDLWNGFPEITNSAYGIAKKALLIQAQAYRQQHGMNSIYLLPVNLYGPGDNFDSESSHVIPAIIRKCVNARDNNLPEITCWGTGSATREFLYVKDAAEAIVLATEQYNKPEPINIGSGMEISIKQLVELIAKLTNYKGRINWDSTQPDGQLRRCLDTNKAKQEFGFKAATEFGEGLYNTIKWYEQNK